MKKINTTPAIMLVITFLFASRLFAGDIDTLSYVNRATTVINQNIGRDPFVLTDNSLSVNEFTRVMKGKAKYWGIDDIEYTAIFNSVDSLVSFSLIMPENEHIKLADKVKDFVTLIAPDFSTFFLPESIKNNLLFDSCFISFDPAKGILQRSFLDFEVLGFAPIFEDLNLGLSKITVGVDISHMDEPGKREIEAELAAEVEWAGTTVKFSSNLVKELKDWKLTGTIYNLTLKNLLEKFNVDLGDTYMPPLPFFDLNKGFEKIQLDIWPASGAELSAKTSFGDFDIIVKYLDSVGVIRPPLSTQLYSGISSVPPPKKYPNKKGWGICAGYSFGESFSFGSFVKQLAFLDKYAQLNNKGIYFSTFTANPGENAVLPVFKYLGSGTTLYKGVTFIFGCDMTKMKLGPVIGRLSGRTGVDYVAFQANIPANMTNLTVDAALVFNKGLNIAKRIYFKNIDLLFEANDGDPKFSVAAMVDVKVTSDNVLTFLFKGALEPFSQTISGGGAMINTWKNVLGFPHLDIGQLELGMGVNFEYDEIPIPDNLSVAGMMSVGGITGKGRIMFDANQLEKNVLIGSIDNLTWNNFIGDFCTDKIINAVPSYIKPIFNSKLNHADIKLAPPGGAPVRTLTGEYINPGFRISADGEVAGWHGNFTIDLEGNLSGLNAGFTASGAMDPIKIDANGIKVFYLTAAQGKGGPEMKFDLSTAKMLKVASGQLSGSDTINYINAAINILEVANANSYCLLTPKGYIYQADAKVYGFFDASMEAQISSFTNPLQNTFVKVEGKPGSIIKDVQKFISKEVLGKGFSFDVMQKGFSLDRIYFAGKLDDLKSGVKAKVEFTIAGKKKSVTVSITVGGAAKLAEDIAKEIVNGCLDVLNDIKQAMEALANKVADVAQQAATQLKQTATKAIDFAKTTTDAAIKVANQAKTKLTQGAQTAISATKSAFKTVGQKTEQFFKDFGNFTKNTVEKIFNKSIDALENGWDKFTDAFKKAFTGGDNEERIMVNGPAFRIITKYQNQVLISSATTKKNYPILIKPRSNNYLETWQLYPNDKNELGSFFLTSGYSGLIITKPWTTHSILIPHESDHKDRERMLMESVPNEPGWYYLKYLDYDTKNNIPYYTYVEVKNVVLTDDKPGFIKNVPQWVLAPVVYAGNNKPGDLGKFKFEKAGDIDWQKTKSFPPVMEIAQPLVDGNRYQFNGEPEQYIYSAGTFRWIPDVETLTAMKFDAKPLIVLPNNQQVSTVLGDPYPSRKDGIVVQAANDPQIFIMDGGKRRWIPDQQTFTMLGLNANMVQQISKADLSAIPAGDDIPSNFAPKTVLYEGNLYRQTGGDGSIFLVLSNSLRRIPDPETLNFMGYNMTQVKDVSKQDLTTLSKGADMASRKDGMLVQSVTDTKIYIMEKGIRRWIPDTETFNALKLDMNKVQKITKQDLDGIPGGTIDVAIPSVK